MALFRMLVTSFALSALSACGGDDSGSNQLVTITPTAPPAPPKIVAPAVPPHNYALKEGLIYSYIATVSEEDKKDGKATGDVSIFKYLGKQDGMHVIASLNDKEQIVYRSRCAEPCVIIKTDFGSRTAYNPSSIIGAVFEDAIAGRLDADSNISKPRKIPENVAAPGFIPARFRGEWNDELNACGTDLSDGRLVITSSKLAFYESDAFVMRLATLNPNALKITASSAGEGQEWTSEMKLVLSRSDNDLTITMAGSSFTRHRCPK